MENFFRKLLKIIIYSASAFGVFWSLLESFNYFGIKAFENTGIVGYTFLVLASLYLGLVIFVLTPIKGKTNSNSLIDLLSTEFSGVYVTKREAESQIKDAISNSSNIRIIAGRGNELQRETYEKLFSAPHKFTTIKILLPLPLKHREKVDWLDQREREIIAFDKSFTKNTLRGQIKINIEFVKNIANVNSNFTLKLYNVPHIGLVTITDNALFFYLLKSNGHGRDSMMFRCNVGSELYKGLTRYFDEIWRSSEEAK